MNRMEAEKQIKEAAIRWENMYGISAIAKAKEIVDSGDKNTLYGAVSLYYYLLYRYAQSHHLDTNFNKLRDATLDLMTTGLLPEDAIEGGGMDETIRYILNDIIKHLENL